MHLHELPRRKQRGVSSKALNTPRGGEYNPYLIQKAN